MPTLRLVRAPLSLQLSLGRARRWSRPLPFRPLESAVSQMAGRIPLMITGDLHAIGEAQILRTRSNDMRANPVISMLSGPIERASCIGPPVGGGLKPGD